MSVVVSATLGDLVIEDQRRARVLEKLGLDYCCNGHRTLGEALAEAGLDQHEVIEALQLPDAAGEQPDAPRHNAALAHDIIDTHHAYMWQEMPRLQALVDKVAKVHGAAHPELAELRATFVEAVAELDPHMTKEERVVFPAISRMEKSGTVPAGLQAQLRELRDEHEVVGDLLKKMSGLTDGYHVPDDACASYRAMLAGLQEMQSDLYEHIHKENNILFPRVLEVQRAAASI